MLLEDLVLQAQERLEYVKRNAKKVEIMEEIQHTRKE